MHDSLPFLCGTVFGRADSINASNGNSKIVSDISPSDSFHYVLFVQIHSFVIQSFSVYQNFGIQTHFRFGFRKHTFAMQKNKTLQKISKDIWLNVELKFTFLKAFV